MNVCMCVYGYIHTCEYMYMHLHMYAMQLYAHVVHVMFIKEEVCMSCCVITFCLPPSLSPSGRVWVQMRVH